MNTQIPFNFVLIPIFNSNIKNSIFMAEELSRIKSCKEYETQIFDFNLEYENFVSNNQFLNKEKNIHFFIELFWLKIFKPNFLTFVTEFDFSKLSLIISEFNRHKPDIKILLIYPNSQYINLQSIHLDKNIESCGHDCSVTKSMMRMLGLLGNSH